MKPFSLVLILNLLLTSFGPALADSPQLYFQHKGFLRDHYYLTDGKLSIRPGFMGFYDIEDAVKNNPKALAYFQKYREYQVYGNWIFWSTFVLGVGGLVAGSANSNNGGLNNPGIFWTGFGVLFAGMFWASHEWGIADGYFLDSVNTYNGVDIKDDSVKKNTPMIIPVMTVVRDQIRFGEASQIDGAALGLRLSY